MSGLGATLLLIVIGTTIWVGVDASKREWKGGGTVSWVIGCLLLWIIVFPWYLVVRNRTPLKGQEEALATAAANPSGPSADQMHRECPYCKEAMRRDASHCPHCRQPSTPWRFHEGRWWFRENEQEPWEWLDERTGEWVPPTTAVEADDIGDDGSDLVCTHCGASTELGDKFCDRCGAEFEGVA